MVEPRPDRDPGAPPVPRDPLIDPRFRFITDAHPNNPGIFQNWKWFLMQKAMWIKAELVRVYWDL